MLSSGFKFCGCINVAQVLILTYGFCLKQKIVYILFQCFTWTLKPDFSVGSHDLGLIISLQVREECFYLAGSTHQREADSYRINLLEKLNTDRRRLQRKVHGHISLSQRIINFSRYNFP